MVSQKKVVSICTITYNHSSFIKECLDSLLSQKTSFEYEIIIGEDGSTDGTREICISYAEKHPDKIKLLLQNRALEERKNYTAPFMYNLIKTLIACKGDYIAICEGDDYWTDPNKLQKQIDFLEKNRNFSISFHNAKIIKNDKLQENSFCNFKKDVFSIEDLFWKNKFPTASCVFRNIIRDYPDWFKYHAPVGDWFLFLMHLEFGKAKYFSDEMSVYRIHENGIHYNIINSKNKELKYSKTALLYSRYIKTFKNLDLYFNKKHTKIINQKILFWHNKLIYPYQMYDSFEEGKKHFYDSIRFLEFKKSMLYIRGFLTFVIPILRWIKS